MGRLRKTFDEARSHAIEVLVGGGPIGHAIEAMSAKKAGHLVDRFIQMCGENARFYTGLGLGDRKHAFQHGVLVVADQVAGPCGLWKMTDLLVAQHNMAARSAARIAFGVSPRALASFESIHDSIAGQLPPPKLFACHRFSGRLPRDTVSQHERGGDPHAHKDEANHEVNEFDGHGRVSGSSVDRP